MKKFGMTFLEIGPKRECQNLPRRKLINIPAKYWQLILISQKVINFGSFRKISVKFQKIINLIYYIKVNPP